MRSPLELGFEVKLEVTVLVRFELAELACSVKLARVELVVVSLSVESLLLRLSVSGTLRCVVLSAP